MHQVGEKPIHRPIVKPKPKPKPPKPKPKPRKPKPKPKPRPKPRPHVISCARPNAAERWIINRESGGSVYADNPTSTAFGLGQLLYGNRVHYGRKFGVSPSTTSYCAQLMMFRLYVRERYGTAGNTIAFWRFHGWY